LRLFLTHVGFALTFGRAPGRTLHEYLRGLTETEQDRVLRVWIQRMLLADDLHIPRWRSLWYSYQMDRQHRH
jgi:hypothetical protein